MNKDETIAELVETAFLSLTQAKKLVKERISMIENERTRKNVEIKLKKIDNILDGMNVENE